MKELLSLPQHVRRILKGLTDTLVTTCEFDMLNSGVKWRYYSTLFVFPFLRLNG